jgi:hypothetical protein
MIKKIVSVMLALLLTLPAWNGLVLAAADDEQTLSLNNDFVAVAISRDTGRFSIETREGSPLRKSDNNKPLLFRHDVPETSFTTFRINGKDYIYGNGYGFLGSDGQFTFRPSSEGLMNQSVWNVGGLEITQTLTLMNDKSNPNVGNVKISYTVRNDSGQDAEVGTRILLDTMLGANDASPITVPGSGQYIQKETEIAPVPAYWKAADDPLAPKVMSYGLLSGWGNIVPDRMVVAHWDGISETKWDYQVNPGLDFTSFKNPYETPDSAVALYWDPATVKAGEQKVFETYYGLGSFYTSLIKAGYNLQVLAPEKLTLNAQKTGYSEEEFEIRAEIDNAVDQAKPLENVTAVLTLPNELEFAPGEKMTQSLSAIGVNETRTFTWKVKPKPQYTYKAARYQLSVQAAGEEETLQAHYVILPAISGEPPEVQVQDLLPNKIYLKDDKKSVGIKGKGFEVLKGSSDWSVQLIRSRDQKSYTIPATDVTVLGDRNLTIRLNDADWAANSPLEPGTYTLRISTANYGNFERTLELTTEEQYKSRSYGILLVVGDGDTYQLAAAANETELDTLAGQYTGSRRILLEMRGDVREYQSGGRSIYELAPGSTINSVIRFDTNDRMKALYGEASQKIVIQKMPRDSQHSGDYIAISGNGVLSIPNFPFEQGEFSVEMVDGENYSLEADPDNGESPIEIEWTVLQGMGVVQEMDYFPVTIKNAVIGKQSVSFGGSLKLNLGGLGNSQQKDQSGSSGTSGGGEGNGGSGSSGGTAGGGGGTGDSGGGTADSGGTGNTGSGNPGNEEEEGGNEGGISVSVDEARFGIRQKADVFGDAGSYGFLGLRAEGEANLPENLVPGMELGAGARVAIDTIGKKYEIEANVKFQIVELYGLFTLRFTEGNIPIPDNFVFSVGGEPGIPLVPPAIVAYITKGGGGFRNIYDTVMGNFNVLPPLQLVMIGGLDIEKVVKGDNLTLGLSLRGFDFSGELEIARFKILKEVYGHILVQDSLEKFGVSIGAGAKLEIFDVITGEVYAEFAFDSSRNGLFGPVSLTGGGKIEAHIPKDVPIFGGLRLAEAAAELSTERVYAEAKVIGIPVSVQYVWGDSMPTFASVRTDAMLLANRGLSSKTYYDQESGLPEGTVIFGSNIRKVGSSRDRYASLDPVRAPVVAAADEKSQTVYINPQDAVVLQFDYEGERPDIGIADPDGMPYEIKEDVNMRIQEIPADESKSGIPEKHMYVSILQPKTGAWKITSSQPVGVSLYSVTIPPSLNQVQAEETGDHTVRVHWQGDHTTDEKVALYISQDNGKDPGHLLADGLDVREGRADVTLPASLPTGNYYIRAAVYKGGTTYNSAYSMESIRVVDPNQPSPPTRVQVSPAGSGLMSVKWESGDAADGYYLQLLDSEGKPVDGAGVMEVRGDQHEALVGGVFRDDQGRSFGLQPGQDYRISVAAYRNADGGKHFSPPAVSAAAHIPQPNPAALELGVDPASGSVHEAYDETGRLYYIVNRLNAAVQLHADQPVEADMRLDGKPVASHSGADWRQTVDLKEGTNIVQVVARNGQGDVSTTGIKIVADTSPPELKIESPALGALAAGDSVTVKGAAEPGSKITVNGQPVTPSNQGVFETSITMDGRMNRHIAVVAEDAAGNQSRYETDVGSVSYDSIEQVRIRPVDGHSSGDTVRIQSASPDNFLLPVGQQRSYELVGTDSAGRDIVIDGANVKWSLLAGEPYGTVSETGIVQAKSEGDMIVKASLPLSDDYALEDAVLVKARENGDGSGGSGSAPDEGYEQWYQPPAGDDSEQAPSGGITPPSGPAQGNPAEDDAFGQMIRNVIENEKNVQFLKSAEITGRQDLTIPIDDSAELAVFRQKQPARFGLGIGKVRDPSVYENASIRTASPMYEFKPDRPVLPDPPPRLKIKLPAGQPGNAGDISLYWYNERKDRWEYIGGEIDPAAGTLAANLPHFGKYALLENRDRPYFADVEERWSRDLIYRLVSIGVIDGMSDDGFEPARTITREQFVKLLIGSGDVPVTTEPLSGEFADSAQVSAWAAPYLQTAVNRKWIGGSGSGGQKTLEPQRPITRAEAAALLGRMLGSAVSAEGTALPFRDAVNIPDWAKASVEQLRAAGILDGYPDQSFRPDAPVTREEAAAMFVRTIDWLYRMGKEVR